MKKPLIAFGLIAIFLVTGKSALADNYCNVSPHAPTYGMNYQSVDALVWHVRPATSVECGILKNLYNLEKGNTTEIHYKNVVLIVDYDDERFVAIAKSDEFSIFAYTDNMGNECHVAVKGEAVRLRPLAPGALAVVEFKDVTLPDGFSLYMPVFERVL